MNPGYLSFLLFTIALILIISGWSNDLIKGIPARTLLILLSCSVMLSPFSIQINRLISINASCVMLFVVALLTLILARRVIVKIHFISAAFFISSIYCLLLMMNRMNMFTIFHHHILDTSLVLSLVVIVFVRKTLYQFAVLTVGIILGDFLFKSLQDQGATVVLGTADFYDLWWFSILITRLLSEILVWSAKSYHFLSGERGMNHSEGREERKQ